MIQLDRGINDLNQLEGNSKITDERAYMTALGTFNQNHVLHESANHIRLQQAQSNLNQSMGANFQF